MNTAPAIFSVSWEWQLCPEAAIQNSPLPGPGTVRLEASEKLKFWNPEILASWVTCEDVSFSASQVFSFTSLNGHCENSAPTRRTCRRRHPAAMPKSFQVGPDDWGKDASLWPGVVTSRPFPARACHKPSGARPSRTRRLCRQFGNGSTAINSQLVVLHYFSNNKCAIFCIECSERFGRSSVDAAKKRGQQKSTFGSSSY
jgi:hypothetical protein